MSLDQDDDHPEQVQQSAVDTNSSDQIESVKPPATVVDDGLNHGKFTAEEEVLFLSGLELHGRDWKKIAQHVITRDSNSIRSRAQRYPQQLIYLQTLYKTPTRR
jgi:esterase/lipase superfamily enzyme